MEEEDQERRRKLEAGKAKLAQFRQRKGQTDSQNATKKSKKKKSSSSLKPRDQSENATEGNLSQSDEAHPLSTPSEAATTTEFTIMRTVPHGEIIKHDQTYNVEPESEISTTADDYSSEVTGNSFLLSINSSSDHKREEEFGVRETYSEHGTQSSPTRLEVMEDELPGKHQEIDELNRELEEMRAAYGTEGFQQLQEFESAIKQRDDIITQLTTNLQLARKEKDEIMREFLELTEQSQKLKIQFQHLQASESLRSTSHTSTATDLLHSKQQIFTYQQQLEEQEIQLKHFQKQNEDYQTQIGSLQEKIQSLEQVYQSKFEVTYEGKLHEKDVTIDDLKTALNNEESISFRLKEKNGVADKLVEDLREQLTLKNSEINGLADELSNSKQKERMSSEEIKQLMGIVEDFQKKHYKGTQSEADLVQRMELETQNKLQQLQAELDEMYGQQIVQMKQELIRQHTLEIEKLILQHKAEVESISIQTINSITNEQIDVLHSAINELNIKLQDSNEQRKKTEKEFSQQLEIASSEKSRLQRQIEELLQDLGFAREQIQKAKQSIAEKETKLSETSSLHVTIEELKSQLSLAAEFTKELESKHDSEVTNYKIKLDMLEREKDAVLDRMAESLEAELEKLRTHFLFSQEEELSKLRDDLTLEHRTNIENLKDNLDVQYKTQIERVKNDMSQTINAMQSEKDDLITKQNHLMLEISKLKDLLQSMNDSKSEEMIIKINELQKEVDSLRKDEKEKGTIEQEAQMLQLRIELLENEVKDKETLNQRVSALETDNRLLKDENNSLQIMLKKEAKSENPELNKEVEKLTLENMQLRNLELQLKEEIERQKNTFSFAEKNFEVNYQELQEENACLLKLKEQLEDNINKQEEKYKVKLHVLQEELAILKNNSAEEKVSLKDSKSDASSIAKLVKADTLEGVDVVEKDTTELMEKLEIAQRDKEELAFKLSDLSVQLQLKQTEIIQLKEEVKCLCQERDDALSGRQKLAGVTNVKRMSSVQDGQEYSVNNELLISNDKTPEWSMSTAKEDLNYRAEELSPNKTMHSCGLEQGIQNTTEDREFLLQRLNELTMKLENESVCLLKAQNENTDLQSKLSTLYEKQVDMKLQLEAQHISLTQIHMAQLEFITKNFHREKEEDICSLKEEMLNLQEQKIKDILESHHKDAFTLKQTGCAAKSCQTLTEILLKTISDEHDRINQCLNRMLVKPSEEIKSSKMAIYQDSLCIGALQKHIHEMKTVHGHLTMLLEHFLKKHQWMVDLQCSLDKVEELQTTKENIDIANVRHLLLHSQTTSADVQEPLSGTQFQSDEIEKLKIEFSQQRTQLEQKHSQEIEHLRFYFQQQLKENEERYTTEIIHLQGQLQNVSDSSPQFSDLSESQSEVSLQESDILNAVYEPVADISKMNESAVKDKPINKCSGIIYQQLQNLRQALSAKYVEEVETLKKQHDTEILQLTIDLKEKYSHENATLKQELAKTKRGNMNGSFQEHSSLLRDIEEKKHMDINQLLEERYHERIEEEIARVIVEMTIAFAQKTELARLAAIKNGEIAEQQEDRENLDTEDSDHDGGRCMISEEHQHQLQSIDLTSQVEIQRALSEHDFSGVELVVIQSSETSLSTEKDDVPSLKHLDQNVPVESHVKTVVLKEDDYNQMVAMGAESAKLRLLYEERVEDMRQELVRQEQEYQQATEALRLSHMSQLERQMYDQEQLLAELHMLRTQLAETALVINENQATEREKMLLEELESLKKPCWKSTEKQDNATQTQLAQDETVTQAESKDLTLEGGHVGEGHEESKDTPSRDLTSESLKKANKQLLKILFEIVKTTGAVEETIGRHVIGLLDKSGRQHSTSKFFAWSLEPENPKVERVVEIPIADHAVEVADTATAKDKSIWSGVAEERLDLPLPLTDVEFAGLNLNPEDEAQVLNISIRLQAAVEKLLEAINETSNQLEHAKAAQTELVHESFKRKQETTELLRCQEELQERLNEEAKAKEHLALELSKAEGLLDGYTEERVFLEKQMQEKTDLIRHLEQELLSTGNRLQEFEQERQQIQEERELLSRQKNALKADASPAEQQLLEETEKLLNEKIEVQRQAEKDSFDLHKHMKVLEAELEEQMNRYLELEQEKNAHLEDLRQKNLALEKQLDKTRKFLDEQAVDREHERDVFQQEIQKLELQLKMPQRHQPVTDHQNNKVDKLESNLKEKTDKCSELLLGKEQLQRDVQERNEEIEKLECRIRELEQALLSTTDSPPKVEERKQSIVSGVKGEMPLEDQLQEEREAIDRKEKEITNLEEQLEQFREELENKNEEVQQLHMQLEIQRKESATQLQEQEQQIKVLTDELDNLTEEAQDNISFNAGHSKPEKFKELLQEKDKEMDQLNEQIGKLQAQLLAASDNKEIEEKNEQIKEYKIQIKCLKSDQERLKKNSEEEIEKLNEVIEKLQEELANIEPNVSMDFTSMIEVAESSKHQLEGMMAQQEANVNDAEVTHVITELEMTQAEVKQLKKELEKLRKAHNKPIGDTTLGTKHGKATINSEQIDHQEKVKEESDQFSIHNLEKELQRLQKEVMDKDIELVQYAEQIKQLKSRSQEVEHLNEMIEKLQMQLGNGDQMPVDFVNSTEGAESSKHQLETVMGEKTTVQKSEMSSTGLSLVNSKLDAAYEDLGLLSKEFENLRKSPESTKGTKCVSEKVGIINSDKVDDESLGETPREKGTDMLENQSLLSSVQEAMQSTIQNIELQLLDSQKVIQDKDLTLLQYSAEIQLLKTQVEETQHLNEVISALHKELEDIKKDIAVGFDSREDYHKNGKHNLGAGMTENVVLHHKLEINNSDMTHSTTELENTETEINILKQDLKIPKTYSESSNVCESNEEMVIGEKTSDIQKLEEALTEKTAELLANQTLLSSVQEAMKSAVENLKSQLHECQNVVKEKELQLLQYMSQAELLNERTHEVEQLNGVIDSLEQRLATIEERVSVECLSGQSNQEGAKMADDESSQLKLEVNVTDPNVADRQSNVKSQDPESCTNYDVLKETLREKTAQLLATQALLTSLQDTSQHTVQNMEAQLQEHQNIIKEKDLELLQYLHEIELLKKQADSEHDKHGEIISAMEDKLREKVASALVSEAQMKAIQVQSKLMHKTEDVCILADGSVATQTDLSKSIGEEEVESKLSVLSLRLLQLEKQLADLHEQLQLEKEHVTTANQQAAEKENKLRELQHILENMKESQDKNFIESQSEDTLTSASQELFRPSQSVEDLEQELQRIKAEAVTTKEELCHFREVSEKLKEELMVKETNVAHLQEELQHVKQCLTQAEKKLAHYMEEQGIQENLAIGVADSVDSQEQTDFDRKTSSSQTDRTLSVNNSNQTPPVHLKDIGVQNEFVAADGSSTSDEVTQIMEQFTEKIGQMQDLHAAEILDMEARHISEADTLRREQYVAVRALTEECDALKAVIDSLRTPAGGVIPDSALPASGKFTDTASSDGTSEWSQGTYTVHNFEPGPDGVRSDDEFSTDFIPNKIKNLLRAVHQEGIQVLTLTEPQSPEKETKSVTVSQNPWLKERKSFLETISSLKALIGKLQIHKESEGTENSDIYECIPDWRGELLRAVQEVFCKEQDVLLAAFHTQLAASSSCDAAAMLNQMQLSLQEQGMEQINAMDCLQNADRRSMLLELRDLREQLISLQNEESASPQYHQKAEDVVSYHLQQENPHPTQELSLQLDNMNAKAKELQGQLHSEKVVAAEIKKELAQTKAELEATLKIQHKHFNELETLRLEVKQRTNELDEVNSTLENEQKKSRELQWALEKEKAKIERREEREREELEDLKILVEDQRLKNTEVTTRLEEERQKVKELNEKIVSLETVYDTELSKERSKVSELQTFLDLEKSRTSELMNTIECRRELETQIQTIKGNEQEEGYNPAVDLINELQSQLDSKHKRIVELMSEVESYKLECADLKQTIEQERHYHKKELKEVKKSPHQTEELLKSKVDDLQRKLDERTLEVQMLQADEVHMKQIVHKLQNSVQVDAPEFSATRREQGQSEAGWNLINDQGNNTVQNQKGVNVEKELRSAPLHELNGNSVTHEGPWHLENLRLRLQQVSAKLKQLAAKANQRVLFETADDEDFVWSQNTLQEVASQLDQLEMSSVRGESMVIPAGTDTNSLTERLLTQNAELTGYVSRLTEEKNDLRNALLKLEGEACRNRQTGPSGDHCSRSSSHNTVNIDVLIATERELWTKEKLSLQKSLKQSEAEMAKLKAELRNEDRQRSLGRESENMALKRIYGKYLRSESYRKALVYQKKYLLLLLGGFQECEEATLALIARMGGQPCYTDLEIITHHSRAFMRFRSAVRVSIAISRMKFLVRRWQRATSFSPGGVNRSGFGQSTGNELRTDSPYLPAGNLELYGDQRHSSSRSRSGFESPQSTVNSHHRYSAVSTDLGSCSHLQHYDPDRALTDYINRLEALQKRLGSVQSGSSAITPTHYGTRR